ncbi:MAG: AAA family ATPase [Bacteroidales bacterium]|nr:AAA family ATPase [Bacteroidales bacterium]
MSYFQNIILTTDQTIALEKTSDFLNSENQVFILKGYAGSGKTTLIKGIIEYFGENGIKYDLMAPTGRAAKVLNQITGKDATTIHKGIYSFEDLEEIEYTEEDGSVSFIYYYKLGQNTDPVDRIYIIDEASMVSDIESKGEFFRFGTGYLLSDLMEFTRINEQGINAKIIFVGDPAQLPPVGMNSSPALDEDYMRNKFGLSAESAEIREIKRHAGDSGIKKASLWIRQCLTSGFFNDFDLSDNESDITNISYPEFLDSYKEIPPRKIVITYKNKTALEINNTVRLDLFGSEMPIQAGDKILIGSNNYNLKILNGEFGVVVSCSGETIERSVIFSKKGGERITVRLEWRQVELLLPENPEGDKTVRGYMLENFLTGDNYLAADEHRALYVDFKNRLEQECKSKGIKTPSPKSEAFKEAIRNDPFFNAILLKYGYAVTCHKAQGGEWDNALVFWDYGADNDRDNFENVHSRVGRTNPQFYRWAYTAVTRASKNLVCIEPPRFSSFSEMTFIPARVLKARNEITGETQEKENIIVDSAIISELDRNGLATQSIRLQDHYIRIRHAVRKKYIEITKWERLNYEIRYKFEREGQKVGLKFWINGEEQFSDKFMSFDPWTNTPRLIKEIGTILQIPLNAEIIRDSVETVQTNTEFHWEIDEKYPFLHVLYDRIFLLCAGHGMIISDISHLDWRERYTFEREDQTAVFDFEYNAKGFFGRVLPLEARCSGHQLVADLEKIISYLKDL